MYVAARAPNCPPTQISEQERGQQQLEMDLQQSKTKPKFSNTGSKTTSYTASCSNVCLDAKVHFVRKSPLQSGRCCSCSCPHCRFSRARRRSSCHRRRTCRHRRGSRCCRRRGTCRHNAFASRNPYGSVRSTVCETMQNWRFMSGGCWMAAVHEMAFGKCTR